VSFPSVVSFDSFETAIADIDTVVEVALVVLVTFSEVDVDVVVVLMEVLVLVVDVLFVVVDELVVLVLLVLVLPGSGNVCRGTPHVAKYTM
jgi:hypothetical protein